MFVIESGDKIQGDAAAAAVVDYHISGLTGTTLKHLADGQLPSSIGDLYTASTTDVAKTIVLVNTDTVERAINLYHTPFGGTARRIIPKDTLLGAGFTLRLEGNMMQVLDTNGGLVTTIDASNVVSVEGDSMTGDLNMQDNLITRAKINDYSIKAYAHGTISANTTIDLEQGNIHTATIGANLTLTFANAITAGDASTFLLELTNGGAFTLTFPASVDWAGGTAPTLTAAGVDILAFYTRDAGSTWHGVVSSTDSK